MIRCIYDERQTFDVGIWEPDDETLAAQEGTLYYMVFHKAYI